MALAKKINAVHQQAGLGILVVRPAAADPQNAWTTIFTITDGPVLVTGLYGLRTVVQAGGASTMQFRHSVGPTVLCAATAITGNAADTMYSITGNPNDGIIVGAGGVPIQGGMMGSQAVVSVQQFGILCFTGNIQVTMTAAAGTGSTAYYLTYIPVNPIARVYNA